MWVLFNQNNTALRENKGNTLSRQALIMDMQATMQTLDNVLMHINTKTIHKKWIIV